MTPEILFKKKLEHWQAPDKEAMPKGFLLHKNISRRFYYLKLVGSNSIENCGGKFAYLKVTSRSTSRLVAHPRIFRLFMKEKFDAYVL